MGDLKAVIVQCGNEEYAISVDAIISIERLEQVNSIAHLPEFMLGFMKIRGEFVPIIDFEQILYNKSTIKNESARVVIVQTKALSIGLLVFDAKEIIDIPESALSTAALFAYSKAPYFTAVASLKNRMVTVVDTEILSQSLSGFDEISEYVELQLAETLKE